MDLTNLGIDPVMLCMTLVRQGQDSFAKQQFGEEIYKTAVNLLRKEEEEIKKRLAPRRGTRRDAARERWREALADGFKAMLEAWPNIRKDGEEEDFIDFLSNICHPEGARYRDRDLSGSRKESFTASLRHNGRTVYLTVRIPESSKEAAG